MQPQRRLGRDGPVAYVTGMKHEAIETLPSELPPSKRPVTREMIERARAGLRSGAGVEHTVVSAWLRTWGTPGRRPFKDWLADWNG